MKRILALVLALIVILAAAPALADRADFVGCWQQVTATDHADNCWMYIFRENGRLLFSHIGWNKTEVFAQEADVGTWVFDGEKVQAYINGGPVTFSFGADGYLHSSTAQVLSRFGKDPDPEKITLLPGTWRVGPDIPAGAYKVEIAVFGDYGASGNFDIYPDENVGLSYFADSYNLLSTYIGEPILGRVVLREGQAVQTDATFYLTPLK